MNKRTNQRTTQHNHTYNPHTYIAKLSRRNIWYCFDTISPNVYCIEFKVLLLNAIRPDVTAKQRRTDILHRGKWCLFLFLSNWNVRCFSLHRTILILLSTKWDVLFKIISIKNCSHLKISASNWISKKRHRLLDKY